jgi:hypothetical protein
MRIRLFYLSNTEFKRRTKVLNELNVEGIVVYSYAYNKDLIVRVACYRDSNRPAKPAYEEGKEKPDYVNIRFDNGVTKNLSFTDDMHIRVKGYLQSREYNETLVEFLTKAKKNPITSQMDVSVVGGKPNQIMCGRNTVEIVVEDYTIIQQAKQAVSADPLVRKPVLNPLAKTKPVSKEIKQSVSVSAAAPSKKSKDKTPRNHRGNPGRATATVAKTE